MSNIEQTKTALSTGTPIKSLKELIEDSAKELGRALPDHLKPERLVRIALTCLRQTPDLAKCTSESFLGALFTAAALGIEPLAGKAYLLPFNNSKKKPDGTWHSVKECQFIMGYRGIVDLFYRHEKAVNLSWGIRHQNDLFKMTEGSNPILEQTRLETDRGPILGYWVIAGLLHGGKPFHYMSLEECLKHGQKHSKTWDKKTNQFYDSSPWKKDQDSMCLKTVLIQLAKILPLSIEIQHAIENDESSRELRPGIDNVLDIPSQTDWDAIEQEVNNKEPDVSPGTP